MKKILFLFVCFLVSITSYAQLNPPIDFESATTLVDFEGGGPSSIVVDPTGGTNMVAQTIKSATAGAYAGTTIGGDAGFSAPLPFTTTATTMSVRVYSPDAGIPVRLKVENKANNTQTAETDVMTTGVNTWETLVFDLSNVVTGTNPYNASNTFDKVSIFFNVATDGATAGAKTYYWDDVAFGGTAITTPMAAMDVLPIDFEHPWVGFGSSSFGDIPAGVEANQAFDGTNASSRVVKIHKTAGAQVWAGASIMLDAPIDFTAGTTAKIKVYSPKANATIRLKIEDTSSPADGNGNPSVFAEIDATVTAANTWEELTFDLTNPDGGSFSMSTSYDRVVLFPDFNQTGADQMFYFDDIMIMGTTPTTSGKILLPLDFEFPWVGFGASDFSAIPASIEANPNATGTNTSSTVTKIHKTAGAQVWAGASLSLASGLNFDNGTTAKIKVYSPKAGATIRLKIEDLSSPTDGNGNPTVFAEIDAQTTAANTWEELTFDLTNPDGGAFNTSINYDRIVLFPDFNQTGADEMYFFDDIVLMEAVVVVTPTPNTIALPLDFECELIDYVFDDFGDDMGAASTELADNPTTLGINSSTKVAKLTKTVNAPFWAGTAIILDQPIDLSSNTTFKVKVYSPKPGIRVRLKLEHATDAGIFNELDANVNQANTWEELSFDFSTTDASNKVLQKVVLFFDFDSETEARGDGSVYHFDEIIQMGSSAIPNCETPTGPTSAAPTPAACASSSVMSLFSDAFSDVTVDTWRTSWSTATFTDVQIAGNATKKYEDLAVVGIETVVNQLDITGMTHFHVDYWTPNMTELKIKLVDFGPNGAFGDGVGNPGGDDTEHEITIATPTQNEWVSLDLSLADFTNLTTKAHFAQLIFSGSPSETSTLFLDNIYFHGDCNPIPECPNLVWFDEFDGSSLDVTKWEAEIGDGCPSLCGWGNSELQYYRAENATVAGGQLTITAKQESFGGRDYTSARLRTKGKTGGDITYGRFEASIKLPTGQGFWPAFWLLHTDAVYGQWPASGEIDIMELVGHRPNEVFATIHYGADFAGRKSTGTTYKLLEDTFNDAFHTFAVEWDEEVIRWYIDDYLYLTKTAADIDPEFWPFNQNFHMLLNLAVGGTFPGSPDGTSVFPQKMEVEYVRVYEGQFPYLTGNREVASEATGEVYSVENAKAGSTFNWTVPTGATITAGQGTNSITVDWGSAAAIGTVSAIQTNGCAVDNTLEMKVKVDVARVEILECVLENFDTDPLITLLSSSNQGETGTIEEDVANPASNAVNSSNLVAKYTRSTNTFDNFQYSTAAIADASKFITSDKTFFMDVYTSAEPGKVITLQLENAAKIGSFPNGRHSRYLATTTVKNAWERLEFKAPERLDGATLDNEVDRIVFLFDANSANTDVYYFDNFDKYCTSTVGECAAISPCIAPATCSITNLTAGICPNGASGTELITVRDANNPNCFASIESPICSDGSMVTISFTAAGSDVSSSFQLLANGVLRATGGIPAGGGVFEFPAPTLEEMDFSITDPCSCDNPHNLTLPDGTFLFEDTVKIDASAFLPGPIAVTLFSQDGNLLTAAGVPYTTATATFLDLGNGMYGLPFYTKPNIPSTIMAQVNGGVPKSFTTDSCSVCVATEPIPTMSEWGLMIFGLLMLNLGLMFIYRKETQMNL